MNIHRGTVWIVIFVVLFFGVLFCTVNQTFAQDLALVRSVAGEVRVIRPKNFVKKTRYTEHLVQKSHEFSLERGDKVITGKYGIALVRFQDGSTAWLDSNSVMRVQEMNFARVKGQKYNVQLSMSLGRVRVQVPQVPYLNKKFQVHTPKGTASVRGTEKLITYDPSTGTRVHVLTGEVALSDSIGESKILSPSQEGKIGTASQKQNATRIDFQFGSLESVKSPMNLLFEVDPESILIYREKPASSIVIESPIGSTPQNILKNFPEYWQLNWWVSHIPEFYILTQEPNRIQVNICQDSAGDCSVFARFHPKQREYNTLQKYMKQ